MIGPKGQILAANQTARTLLDRADWLAVQDGYLQLPELLGPVPASLESKLIRIPRAEGEAPWLLWVTPLLNGSATPNYRAVSIFDPDLRMHVNRALLKAAFNLTRAELDLAEQLAMGRRPQEAADALKVTIHTVRTYLKRLFNKTGVRTQATLVGRLLEVLHSLPEAS